MLTSKQMFWHMTFAEKVDMCEGYYHAWQLRQDEMRRKKVGQAQDEALPVVGRARLAYNQCREELAEWVKTHPYPKEDDNA